MAKKRLPATFTGTSCAHLDTATAAWRCAVWRRRRRAVLRSVGCRGRCRPCTLSPTTSSLGRPRQPHLRHQLRCPTASRLRATIDEPKRAPFSRARRCLHFHRLFIPSVHLVSLSPPALPSLVALAMPSMQGHTIRRRFQSALLCFLPLRSPLAWPATSCTPHHPPSSPATPADARFLTLCDDLCDGRLLSEDLEATIVLLYEWLRSVPRPPVASVLSASTSPPSAASCPSSSASTFLKHPWMTMAVPGSGFAVRCWRGLEGGDGGLMPRPPLPSLHPTSVSRHARAWLAMFVPSFLPSYAPSCSRRSCRGRQASRPSPPSSFPP